MGFVRGYVGGSEENSLGDGPPYIHTQIYLDPDSDAYEDLKSLESGHTRGPLFIVVHVRETVDLGYLKGVVERLTPEGYEFVDLDEFMSLLKRAIEADYSEDEIFPKESAVEENTVKSGKETWPTSYEHLNGYRKLTELEEEEALSELNRDFKRFMQEQVTDAILYAAINSAFRIVRSALSLKEVYVNSLEKSVEDFLSKYGHISDAGVVEELYLA